MGADVQQAVSLLATELDTGLELCDPLGRVVARAGQTEAPAVTQHALATADASLGTLTAHQDQDLDEPAAQLLAAASGILALQLSRHRERYETEQRLHRQFLIDLLRPGTDQGELMARASLLGLDLQSPRTVCCMGIHVGPKALSARPPVLTGRALEIVEQAVTRRFPRSIAILHGAAAVILVPQSRPDREALVQGLRAALADATQALTGMQLSAGLGAVCLTPDDYAGSYQDAALALELARCRPAGGVILAREQLGIYGMLARSLDPEGLRSCILPMLAPLLRSDDQRGTEHLRTLRVYLAHDRHLQRTADALHLHVNSLRYRLHRIEQLLAVDLHNPDDLFHLELAVRIADVVRPTSN
jgi:sugar diacid utilization regulator